MAPQSLGVGILSFAHGHIHAYARMIQTFEDAHLVACWDDNVQRGVAEAQSYGIPFVRELEDILSRKDIECFIVTNETNRHAEIATAALYAGKGVLLEKPMATTLGDCDRIVDAVHRTGQWFSMAFQMRVDPQNIAMRDLVRSDAVGRVGFVRRRHCISLLFNSSAVEGDWRWLVSPEANKGMFFDNSVHALDWLYWTFDEAPISVMAEIDNVLTEVAPDDTGAAIFRFPSGLMASVMNTSVCLAGENTTEIYGDRGVIIQNYGDGPSSMVKPRSAIGVKIYQKDKSHLGWQDLELPLAESQGDRIAAITRPFVDAYRAGETLCSAEEGRVSVEMALACYQSASTGQRVAL